MSVEIAHAVGPARLDIAYERFGDPELPPVLLAMGLGTQMLGWPDDSATRSPATACTLSGSTTATSACRRTSRTRPCRMCARH